MKLNRDIQSLSTFKRDTSKFLKQMNETGEPLVLTVNGKPAAVVLHPEEYDLLRDRERRKDRVRHRMATERHAMACHLSNLIPGQRVGAGSQRHAGLDRTGGEIESEG